jgi:hypothetical protein
MVSIKDRLKAKFGRNNAPVTPRVEVTATPHQAAPAAATAVSPSNLPERLWDEAYGQASVSDSNTVDAYEKILSARLSEHNAGGLEPPAESTENVLQQNEIAHDVDKRRLQMQQLVQHGLRKTEKDAAAKQGIGDGIQAAMVVKEVVDKAIQASPEAAVAWVGVCFALEVGAIDIQGTISTDKHYLDFDEPAHRGKLQPPGHRLRRVEDGLVLESV